MEKLKILLIEENPDDARLISEYFSDSLMYEFIFSVTGDVKEALHNLEKEEFNLIIFDLNIEDNDSMENFLRLKIFSYRIPIIVLSGHMDEEYAIKLMKIGAQDFIVKSLVLPDLLVRSAIYAIERARLINELEREKEQLHVTLKSIKDIVISIDTSGKILLKNEVALKWKEIENTTSIYQVFQLCLKTKTADDKRNLKEMIEKGTNFEWFNKNANQCVFKINNAERTCTITSSPIYKSNQLLSGVVFVFRDITDNIRLQQEMMNIQRFDSLGILAGGIAHDFNNILMNVLGNIYIANSLESPNQELKVILKDAENAILQAKDLTQQLLTITRANQIFEKKIVNLKHNLVHNIKFALRGSNIIPNFKIEENLWSVLADEGQINQVIYNIIINAKQCMPDGGTVEVECKNIILDGSSTTLPQGRYILISIKDYGSGISQENMKKIFEPYFTTKEHGHGLGLATAFAIIRKHEGTITVESEIGKGSRFTIYLPVKEETNTKSVSNTDESVIKGKGRIIIMDDDQGIQKISKKLINTLGYYVEITSNGTDLLKEYETALKNNNKFDIVILDLTIKGGMGGIRTMELLRKMDPNVKAIVSSGYSKEPVMANYKDYGFKGVLPKPYSLNHLSKILDEVMKI